MNGLKVNSKYSKQQHNDACHARKFWCIFVFAILETNCLSEHLSKCNLMQNPYLKVFQNISKKPYHIITMMCMNKMNQSFINIDLLQA